MELVGKVSAAVIEFFDSHENVLLGKARLLPHDISTESFLTCYFSAKSPEGCPLGCI
jgi:hypothetical protein